MRPLWAFLSTRWRVGSGLLLLGFVVLIPTWIVLPPDDEGLFMEVEATAFQAKRLFSEYPFWNPWIGFGVPHPFSETLTFHPFFLLLVHFASLAVSIGLLYQVQIWIALFSVWAVCRHLGMRTWISSLCVVTFALSAATVNYLNDFWPSIMVGWTLSPLLLLLVLKLLDSERRSSRAVYSLSAGLCAGLMLLNGHAGVFPLYALGFVAFLAGRLPRVRQLWPWLGLALLVVAFTTATKVYDILLEVRLAEGTRVQQVCDMNYGGLFLYPLTGLKQHCDPATGGSYRLIAIGGPFVLLALVGLFYRGVSQRHATGLRIGVAASFLAWYLPVSAFPLVSGNWYARDPLTLFAIFLAGLALQRLWDGRPRWRPLLLAAAGLQVAVLVWGFYPFYRDGFTRAIDYPHGRDVPSLRNALKNQELYRYFEHRPDRRTTRIYMASRADERLFRSLRDYEAAGWALHRLRLVNGHFRGIDVHEFVPVGVELHGEIRGDTSLPRAEAALNVLNIGYVLATPDDSVSPSLVRYRRFELRDGAMIDVYRNPAAWPDAVVLSPKVKAIEDLPRRPGCTYNGLSTSGLLCRDFAPVEALRIPNPGLRETWHGTTLEVRLSASRQPAVLLLSQMYRPGWKARLSDGRTVDGYPLLSGLSGRGLTGFDLPAGVRSAEIEFRPTKREVLAGLSWATLLLGFVFIVATPVVIRLRRGKP